MGWRILTYLSLVALEALEVLESVGDVGFGDVGWEVLMSLKAVGH